MAGATVRAAPATCAARRRSASTGFRPPAAAPISASKGRTAPVVLRERRREDRPLRSRRPAVHRVRSADRERDADRHHGRRRRQSLVRREGRQQDRPHHARGRDHGVSAADAERRAGRHDPRPDGNVWFSETEVSQIGRITPDGKITEFRDGITPGSKPLSIAVRDGALWFSEAAGNRVGRITVDGVVTEFPIPSHDSQPRAMVTHPDGSIWFVRDEHQCARPHRPQWRRSRSS